MTLSRRQKPERSRTARRISVALLVAVCAAQLPVLQHDAVEKDRSTPFPCQHRACGCRSVSHCWAQCCCFTPAQKIAWAMQRGLAVPKDVLAQASPARQEASVDGGISGAGASASTANRSRAARASRSCCSTNPRPSAKRQGSSNPSEPFASPRSRVRVVSIFAASQECRGNVSICQFLPVSLAGPSMPNVKRATAVQRLEVLETTSASAARARPPVPPPRCV